MNVTGMVQRPARYAIKAIRKAAHNSREKKIVRRKTDCRKS
jgi:hypothetical protein